MGGTVLALVENSIGPRLLLASRLGALGYAVTVVSAVEGFRRRIRAEAFDWLIVDEAVAGPDPETFLERLARSRRPGHVVWLGPPPRRALTRIETTFEKPLDYDKIVRFFSRGPDVDTLTGGC